MAKDTNFVTEGNMNITISSIATSVEAVGLFGQMSFGPYMPIKSSEYNIDVISTSDFSKFDIEGHY